MFDRAVILEDKISETNLWNKIFCSFFSRIKNFSNFETKNFDSVWSPKQTFSFRSHFKWEKIFWGKINSFYGIWMQFISLHKRIWKSRLRARPTSSVVCVSHSGSSLEINSEIYFTFFHCSLFMVLSVDWPSGTAQIWVSRYINPKNKWNAFYHWLKVKINIFLSPNKWLVLEDKNFIYYP